MNPPNPFDFEKENHSLPPVPDKTDFSGPKLHSLTKLGLTIQTALCISLFLLAFIILGLLVYKEISTPIERTDWIINREKPASKAPFFLTKIIPTIVFLFILPSICLIRTVIASRMPTKKNVIVAIVLGFLFGGIIGAIITLIGHLKDPNYQ